MKRHPGLLKVMVPAGLCLYIILALGFGVNAQLAGAVGRDPTLTDRTKIWHLLLSMHTNPLLGTGYESFWLGPRLVKIWQRFGPINEAHNGYLEVYLNLGLIGLFLLIVIPDRQLSNHLPKDSSPFPAFASLTFGPVDHSAPL